MRLLVVVAHPDDESFGCGSVLARAAADGWHTTVVCATRGEAGESDLPPERLAEARELELRDAARILGVADVRVLGHADSGMEGEPPPGALVTAETLVDELRAVVDDLDPDVVVTLDGSDGHRDHAAVRDATLAAAGDRSVYLWCLARSSMVRWAEHMRATGGGEAYLAIGQLGTPDAEITHRVDVAEHLDTRWRAIRAHTSQPSPYDDLPADLQRDFLAADRLRHVRGPDRLAP